MARRVLRSASVFFVLVCLLGGTAVAAEKVVDEMDALNRSALAAYRGRRANVARRQLLQALVLAEDSGITNHRVVARTYVNLGVVHLMALGQRKEAVNCFVAALKIAPDIRPPAALAKPKVRLAMQQARLEVKRAASRRPEPPPAPEPAEPVAAADPDPAPSEPAAAFDPGAKEGDTQPEQPEPREQPRPARLASASPESEEEPPRLSSDPDEISDGGRPGLRRRHRGPGTFWIGLGVGSAVGATRSRALEHHTNRIVKAGPLFGGLLHLLPEVGFQITRGFALSLQSRHQYIRPSGGPDPTVMGSPPSTAHALLACLYFRLWESERLQLVGTAAAGGGSGFRLKVQPAPQVRLNSSDTVDGGPVIGGPGLTMLIALGESLVLTPGVRVLVGGPNLAVAAEGAVGLQYAF